VFFVATSAFLFVMAVKFIGLAIQEFQEIGAVSVTDAGLPEFVAGLGLNPTIEAISAQLMLIIAALGTYLAMRRKSLAVAAAAA
jgi:high-affinity iron transporter